MIRLLFLLHRYLGIAVSLIMLIWTLSGVVMMYKEYPELSTEQRIALLSNIDTTACCDLPRTNTLQNEFFTSARIETLLQKPVLRATSIEHGLLTYDLSSGLLIDSINSKTAQTIAVNFAYSHYPDFTPQLLGKIHNDQWTVYGAYNPLRPLYKYQLDDPAGTQFYISSKTGEIIQLTSSSQRVWGYLGAVIHWLYPTILREHTVLWSQVVIWLTILGIFLTGTGLYIGVRQYRIRANGRKSPYRGVALYHHYAGLLFGVFTLTWVSSGLLSMNPWGALEGEGTEPEIQRLTQRLIQWSDIETVVTQLSNTALSNTARLEISILHGEPQLIAYSNNDSARRLNPSTLRPSPLNSNDLSELANSLQPHGTIASQTILTSGDKYYYDHHVELEFPIYRVIMDDKQQRHYYLSPVSGQLQRKVDGELRLYRWLFYGLHRGDFSVLFRTRPVWDIFMLLFLFGVTLVSGTGSYMAVKRIRRDVSLFKHKASKCSQPTFKLKDM